MRLVIIGLLLINGCKTANQAVSEPEFLTREHDDPHYWEFVEGYELEDRFLVYKVHEKSWDIDYGFAPDCSESDRKKLRPKVVEAIRKATNLWLSPLKILQKNIRANLSSSDSTADKQIKLPDIVNQIHIHEKEEIFELPMWPSRQRAYSIIDPQQMPNEKKDPEGYSDFIKSRTEEMSIVFNCTRGRSFVSRLSNDINIYHKPTVPEEHFIPGTLFSFLTLMHEIGHVFGLADTYVSNKSSREHMESTGVHNRTIGHQVISVMGPSSLLDFSSYNDIKLTADDQTGIKWFYAHVHMDYLKLDTCPPYYEEESFDRKEDKPPTVACRPTHPFLFSMMTRNYSTARLMLNDKKVRESININVQYKDEGFTAIHYAVLFAPIDLTKLILEKFHKEIDLNIEGTIMKEMPPSTPLETANFFLEKVTKHDMPQLIDRYKDVIDLLSKHAS